MNRVLSSLLFVLINLTASGQQTESSLRSYLEKSSKLEPIEGIWEIQITREFYHFDTLYDVKNLPGPEEVAIVKDESGFTAHYIKGDKYDVEFSTTDVKGVYMYRNYYQFLSNYSKKQAVICTRGKMEYTYDMPEEYAMKICGSEWRENTRVVNILHWQKVFPVQP